MNEQVPPAGAPDNKSPLTPLVERLDPSIGEMSTVVGAMMTELLRRTLRGSVRQIDEELQGQVAHKVDATIAQRMPAVEQSASEAAHKAAHDTANKVVGAEVQALEQRAKETEREIVGRIETTARAAEQHTVETARSLTGKIELVEKAAELQITSKAHELQGHIAEAERRAHEATQAEISRQVEDLMQRSRKTVAGMKEKLQALDATIAALQAKVRNADERYQALTKRVTELEKPRGLRALWAKLFGRNKKQTPVESDSED